MLFVRFSILKSPHVFFWDDDCESHTLEMISRLPRLQFLVVCQMHGLDNGLLKLDSWLPHLPNLRHLQLMGFNSRCIKSLGQGMSSSNARHLVITFVDTCNSMDLANTCCLLKAVAGSKVTNLGIKRGCCAGKANV
jgi:hypothetical protein